MFHFFLFFRKSYLWWSMWLLNPLILDLGCAVPIDNNTGLIILDENNDMVGTTTGSVPIGTNITVECQPRLILAIPTKGYHIIIPTPERMSCNQNETWASSRSANDTTTFPICVGKIPMIRWRFLQSQGRINLVLLQYTSKLFNFKHLFLFQIQIN